MVHVQRGRASVGGVRATGNRNETGSGRRVGNRYRLDELIGRGGAGAVWRAYDERLQRPVAVKEILWPVDPREFGPERALREARAAARLRDPGVVQVYDMLTDRDRAYLVMELVDAPSLDRLVEREGPLAPRVAAALGIRILSTLTAAHSAGIIHRDVKPSNVLIEGDVPRLTDFGIARLGDDPALTATGTVMGTPSFIAPEQARGAPAGPPADLYGLGATLYFAVEGVPPFAEENSLQTAMAVVSRQHRPPQRAGHLTGVIEALLQKDPEARPDADEVRRQLEEVAASPGPESIPTVALGARETANAAAIATRRMTSRAGATAADTVKPQIDPNEPGGAGGGRRLLSWILGLLLLGVLALAGLSLLAGDDPVDGEDTPAETPPAEADDPAADDPAPEDTAPDAPAPDPGTASPPPQDPTPEGETPAETPDPTDETDPGPGEVPPEVPADPEPGNPPVDPPANPPATP